MAEPMEASEAGCDMGTAALPGRREGATEGAAAESKVSGSKLAAGAGVEKAATPAEAEAKGEAAPAAAAAAKECATGS